MLHKWRIVTVFAWLAGVCLAQQGYYREVYYNIEGTDIANLTTACKYPDQPDEEQIVHSGFDTPANIGEFYGQRLRAYLTPQISGYYRNSSLAALKIRWARSALRGNLQ
jgi:hypothetical protein